MRKKIAAVAALIALLFALVSALTACKEQGEEDKTVFPAMKEYSLTDGSGSHVADVPYDEYLDYDAPAFSDKTVIDIRDQGAAVSNSAAENTVAIQSALDEAELSGAVVGCEYNGVIYPVKNVILDNFNVAYRECGEDLNIYNGNDVLHANMNGYPEITRVSHVYLISHELSSYYDMPVYGLYLYNVDNIRATSFNVKPRSVNTRPFTNYGIFDERDGIVNCSVSTSDK